MQLIVKPLESRLRGAVAPPGDKSISHRALIFATLAEGRTILDGLLQSEDTLATLRACEQLGAGVDRSAGRIIVTGTGGRLRSPPGGALDMGNSGTAMRLLAGVLSGQDFDCSLAGDASLNSRPMQRIVKPLTMMGANITATLAGTAPLRIGACDGLTGIEYNTPVASAQIKSCVLLAGLFAAGHTRVIEPRLSRDHTERMLPAFGVELPAPCTVVGGARLLATDFTVPADVSSAVFLLAAAVMNPASDVITRGVGLNPTRSGLLLCLQEMGAALELSNQGEMGSEPVADIRATYNGTLNAIDVPESRVPDMIDELPLLMALAATARGTTRIRGAAELRVKESDRLAVMAAGLREMGVSLTEYPDGIDIDGGAVSGGEVESACDHRCAMSFALLGLASRHGAHVADAEYIATSYPGFVDDLQSLGANIEVEQRS